MSTENLNLSSDTSGATSSSVPQLTPIFSYPVDGGLRVSIYIFNAKSKIAIATLDDSNTVYAYSALTLIHWSDFEVYKLLTMAEKNYGDSEDNPFTKLIDDHEAMSELYRTIAR